MHDAIILRGVRQHNLQDVTVHLPKGKLTVITGVSGSGKSSLAFDTLYAEGQRRYVESFSTYARQFLERMDRPDMDSIDGVMPAVAIEHRNHIRSSRSTVATVTEIADHLKLLFAGAAQLYCDGCGEQVRKVTPVQVADTIIADFTDEKVTVGFPFHPAAVGKLDIAEAFLRSRGYFRVLVEGSQSVLRIDRDPSILSKYSEIIVVQDRTTATSSRRSRLAGALEQAMREGDGRAVVNVGKEQHVYSNRLHCGACSIQYQPATAALFSFNTPVGACPECNGFGRTIGLDIDLCIPNERLSIEGGAVKPWNTKRTRRKYRQLVRYCLQSDIPIDVPWSELGDDLKQRVVDGDRTARWTGIRGWFKRLEKKTYRMHVRVFLSRYRAYLPCAVCNGARFRPEALRWRLDGLNLAELLALNVSGALARIKGLVLPESVGRAVEVVHTEIVDRLGYLDDVGLAYLTLDRPSRTLSGGEVQRVNLTTALGSRLVGTLYVLDEPSVGLHARDNERLLSILRGIRDLGNTVVVVEHDEAIIRGADHVIDLGPGSGSKGGNIIYNGPPNGLVKVAESVTGRFLAVNNEPSIKPAGGDLTNGDRLTVRSAQAHNLRNLDVSFPVGKLSCVTGVSGSGKSTLVVETLYRGLLRSRGEPTSSPGKHDGIEGSQLFDNVVLIDATPVSTSPRSNAATFLKAWDPIRKMFAAQDGAVRRGFSPSTFSFNVAGGRCETCQGSGFERIEMQFLSDVFLCCEACHGTRFQAEVLDVTYQGMRINDVLELTAQDAIETFSDASPVIRALTPLVDVGLGYLRLGQPLNTLSVGEVQRLKLAEGFRRGRTKPRSKRKARLALRRKPTLFILDEPTTGLHMSDVATLVGNFRGLTDAGHTVIVVEHHLDVIRAADYVVDLGPEGGSEGGRIVVEGSPQKVATHADSHTAQWMRTLNVVPSIAPPITVQNGAIVVKRARVHNLKGIDVTIPHGQMTVVTGPSGSGKSSLAFDVLFAEGQRRFIDCLSPYARQYLPQVARPELDELHGIPPTVAIEQRTTRWNRRSTVATVTEIYHFLRLLYARAGRQHCHLCGCAVQDLDQAEIQQRIAGRFDGHRITLMAPVVRRRKGWHKDTLVRAAKMGHEKVRIDGKIIQLSVDAIPKLARFKEHDIEIVFLFDRVIGGKTGGRHLSAALEAALKEGNGTCYIQSGGVDENEHVYSRNLYCDGCQVGFDPPDPRLFSFHGNRSGACRSCDGAGSRETDDGGDVKCATCDGTRLRKISRSVFIGDVGIDQAVAKTPGQLRAWLDGLKLSSRERAIAEPIVAEISERCRFLVRVGLDYLTLDRGGHTLSGGEAQRVRLAAQLSAHLCGVLYVLDEPTIGLHPSDNERLLDALDDLKQAGNTVVVVEHDQATISRADHVIDMGPGAGRHGGHIVAVGTPSSIKDNPNSLTGKWLTAPTHPVHSGRPYPENFLKLRGVTRHNLTQVDVDVPLGRLTVVTGVSGSGKSTLIREVLLPLVKTGKSPYAEMKEGPFVERVIEVDQAPIGRTPRSIPATYIGIMDNIRKLYSRLPEAQIRGYGPGRFSFNVKTGRCAACKGQGAITVEMAFLPNSYVPCDQCEGRRYNRETLHVLYRERSIADVLEATVDEALEIFEAQPRIFKPLQLMADMGLGYLTLGQASNTLSGGEAQRIKLVTELHKLNRGRTVYILDEPSTGLHMADLSKLLKVIQRLVEAGNTVVVIEHNLDVIAAADWIIDLGPGGGSDGGRLIFQGAPSELVHQMPAKSKTALHLNYHLIS